MKLKRIDFFSPQKSRYAVLQHFTDGFSKALEKAGIKVRVLEIIKDQPGLFLEAIAQDPPDLTISFNGVLPSEKGEFLCDLLKIPHLAFIVDSPGEYLSLALSQKTIASFVDRSFVDFFKNSEISHTFFLPHAVEDTLKPQFSSSKKYDVIFLGSCIDYEQIRQVWVENFHPSLSQSLDAAAEEILSHSTKWSIPTFIEAMERQPLIFPKEIPYQHAFFLLEQYVTGKERLEMLKAIQGVNVHIFGEADFQGGWEKYLGTSSSNLIFHPVVSFAQALELMKQSKITLHSCPKIKNGSHERVFSAMSCGSLVMAGENQYLREQFPEEERALFFKYGAWDRLNEQLNKYVKEDALRLKVAKNGADFVQKHHTWDHRARQLLAELSDLEI